MKREKKKTVNLLKVMEGLLVLLDYLKKET